jgi:hypothetical protein
MRRILSLFSGILAVAVLAAGAPAFAQSTTTPRAVFQATVPGIRLNKFPDIAAFGRTVHIGSNSNRRDAVYVTKPDTATTFSAPLVLGLAEDQGDYSPVTIATGPDGAVYFAYLNFVTGRISLRIRPANSTTWGPERLVYSRSGSEFLANLHMGVGSDNAIYVAWRVADQKMRVRRSADGGLTWSSVFQLGERFGIGLPFVATGRSGQAAVVFTAETSAVELGVFAAIWNGSGFTTEPISPSRGGFANPSAAYDPDGNLYAAYRGVEKEGGNSGLFFATRAGAGSWQVQRLLGPSEIFDLVNVQSDEAGNLHLAWIATASGQQQVFYAFRPRGGAFGDPVAAANPGGAIFNPTLAANVGDQAYGHVVSEFFQGDSTLVRYYLFAAAAAAPVGAQPVIEDGEQITEKEPSVSVRFDNVRGTPTQIRWRWGSAPTDAANDSSGWRDFKNPMDIPLPDSILANVPCSPVRLFTQVREADGDLGQGENDDITVDTGINAALSVGNPYSRKASEFTPVPAALADVGTGGASDGDLGYTRDPIYYVQLLGTNDCSGIKSLAVGRGGTSTQKAIVVSKETFANVLGYPGTMVPGPNQLLVQVVDQAGNIGNYPQSIILDQVRPVLDAAAPGTLAVAANAKATMLTRLTFSNVAVTDDRYPGGFWGVWIANSRTQVADPATSTALNWYPLRATAANGSFVINNWSLATGLPGPLQPGTYYVYVRFLDGAGNASTGVLSASVSLSAVTRPQTSMPLIRR